MLKIFLLPLSTCLLVNEIRFSSWPLLRISVLPEARLEAFLIHLSREVLPIDPINPSVQQLNEQPVLLKQMKLIKDACFSNASRNHSLFAPSAFYSVTHLLPQPHPADAFPQLEPEQQTLSSASEQAVHFRLQHSLQVTKQIHHWRFPVGSWSLCFIPKAEIFFFMHANLTWQKYMKDDSAEVS